MEFNGTQLHLTKAKPTSRCECHNVHTLENIYHLQRKITIHLLSSVLLPNKL